ncbi:uncharacterized protein LOC110873773 [Helianthus annuus]|uniref:uncharacterized protein LOC110873773 n=1 Tax=Helianthus annuus TaxID=4232 RepID=UPI001652C7AE|nr:uncharacterized protein LOC110873773 [Helianthus annuus]
MISNGATSTTTAAASSSSNTAAASSSSNTAAASSSSNTAAASSSSNTAAQSLGLKNFFKTPEGRYKLLHDKTHPSFLLPYALAKSITQGFELPIWDLQSGICITYDSTAADLNFNGSCSIIGCFGV